MRIWLQFRLACLHELWLEENIISLHFPPLSPASCKNLLPVLNGILNCDWWKITFQLIFPRLAPIGWKKISFSFDWLVCVSCNWQTIWFNWLRVQRHSNLISKRKFQLNNIKASRECLAKQKINKLINWNLKHKNGYDFFSSKHFVTSDASIVISIWFSKLFSQHEETAKNNTIIVHWLKNTKTNIDVT